MPEAMQGFAAIVVSQAYRYSMETLSLSVVTLVWSASKGTMALRQGLNRVYGVEETRPYPVQVLLAIGYTAALLVMFALMLFLLIVPFLFESCNSSVPVVHFAAILRRAMERTHQRLPHLIMS